MTRGLGKGTALALALAVGGCGPAGGYLQANGGNAGSDEHAGEGLHPAPQPGPTAADICADFAESLGDDALEADVYAELTGPGVYLSVWHASAPLPACEDVCNDLWTFSVLLPLPIQGSFDLAANETLGDFTIASTQGKECGCIAGSGLASGSIDIVAMDAEAVCGWMVEDDLFDVSGGFSTVVNAP